MRNYINTLAMSARKKFNAYRKDQFGSILQMSAFAIIPVFLCAGAAIDLSRVSYNEQQLGAGLDAGALAAAAASGKTEAELKVLARRYLDENFKSRDNVTVTAFDLKNYPDKVVVTGTARVKTSIMMLASVNYVDLNLSSEVVKVGNSIEVSLVLDNTGSMTPNMSGLKDAAKQFVDTVVWSGTTPYYSKVAIIPYNMGVNLGTLANAARGTIAVGTNTLPGWAKYTFKTNTTDNNGNVVYKTHDVSTCVSERTGTQAYTDAAVASNPVGRAYPPGSGNPCISAKLLPLTNDTTALKASIDSMVAGSSTAGQVGVAWGWYALSPDFGLWSGSSVPASYTAERLHKIMILMTDAEYNSSYCNGVITGVPTTSGSGSSSDHINCAATNSGSYTQSKTLCTAMKQKGVEIYTIEFQLDTSIAQRVDLVSTCATDSAHRITASDSAGLKAAFQKIASNLLDIRISK